MSAELPKMPEPVAMLVRWSAQKNERADVNPWVAVEMALYGPNPGRDEQQLFTADQMREYAQEATRQAMERCAEVCEEVAGKHLSSGRYVSAVADHAVRAGGQVDGSEECAKAIRTLLPQDPDHLAGVGNMVEAPTSGNGEGEKQ